jgi:CheY-like chemotaxis protein
MSINEINAEAKESLRKYFKNSQDVKHENEARKELTKEEIFESVAGEIKESEMKLEQRNQMRNTLQQDAKEAFEKVCGKKSEAKEVEHMTLEGILLDVMLPGMSGYEVCRELKENTKHQMEYVNSLKRNTMNARA